MSVTRKTRAKKYAAAMSTIRTDTSKSDGWVNPTIGFGTSRDKITAGYFLLPPALQPNELGALYYHNDLASRIVETRPKEALRRGYEIETATEDLGDEIYAYGKQFGLDAKIQEAWIWARLYGGSVILVGADDLQPPWRPLNRKNVRSIKFLNVLDSRFLYPVAHYQDPLQGNFGLPELYQIQTPEGAMSLVHESRLIRFEGTHVDRLKRRELNGWSYSVLQRVYDVLRSFETAFQAAGILLSDASQGVFKIDGLIDMIAAERKTRSLLVCK
jgi:phage-related protein (TIGR01555 family)